MTQVVSPILNWDISYNCVAFKQNWSDFIYIEKILNGKKFPFANVNIFGHFRMEFVNVYIALNSFEKKWYKNCCRRIKNPKFFRIKCQKQLTTCFSEVISSNMENDYGKKCSNMQMDIFCHSKWLWVKFFWHFEYKKFGILGKHSILPKDNLVGIIISA